MKALLAVGVVVFWIVIALAMIAGARTFNSAVVGAIVGVSIIPLVASSAALGVALRSLSRGQRPIGALVVLGVVAAWSIHEVPRFWQFQCRSLQWEARENLAAYGKNPALDMPNAARFYRYDVKADGMHAIGVAEMAGDDWAIRDFKPVVVNDVCD
jgi:hypothetical protein